MRIRRTPLSERTWYDNTGLDLEPDTVVEVVAHWTGPARAFTMDAMLYGHTTVRVNAPGKLDRIEVKRAE